MKILRVVNDLYPSVVGGLGLHAHELSKAQAKLGHDVTVITSKVDGSPTHEERDGYRITRLRPIGGLVGNTIMPSVLFELFKHGEEYDIIHAHSHLFFSTNLSAAFRHFSSTPLVITNHGLISQTAPAWLQKIYLPTVAKSTFRSADGVICYTEYERSELVKLGINLDNIAVIHNGIDTDRFGYMPSDGMGKALLWIGRYAPGKGVDYLLDAFALFLKNHPGYILIMVGRGPEKEAVGKKIAQMGLAGSVSLRDFIPNQDLPDLYRHCCAFILPSLSEGVPRTVLEAMACGIPVICTELPQLVNIVDGAGLFVPLRNSQAIADALDRIVTDRDLASRLGQAGLRRVKEHYSWNDTVDRTIRLYQYILDRRSRKCSSRSIAEIFTEGPFDNHVAKKVRSRDVCEVDGKT